ncbi:MAG: carboxymethylenebutenolidase [Frankiaceae bacterium]|jgi:carboxymethylenebutenolidase|nr:carboxymethylenebutenolidase [Frankiaceae bacterium]
MSRGVIVVQEAFGITPHVEDVVRRFEAEGYAAVAPALFHRIGSPVFSYDGGFDAIRPAMASLTGEGLLADVDAAVGSLGLPPQRIAIVGFCMGGTVALYAGAMRELGAAVSFYGGGVMESRWEGVPPLVDVAPGLRTPWLGLYGDTDAGIPVADVEALRSAASLAPVPTRVERFADAGHGFFNDARAASYSKPAAEAAWPMVLSWLRQNLPD